MTIAESIKELRLERGLSQAALAKSIGVSQKAIEYWERGVNEPKATYIDTLYYRHNIYEICLFNTFNRHTEPLRMSSIYF